MALPSFTTSADDRALAGVCAGIAQALSVDVTLVRLAFTLLALAGGAGIVLYLALWAYGSSRRNWVAVVLALVAGGFALAWRRGGTFRPGEPLSYGGLLLAGAGAVLLLQGGGASTTVL